MLLAKALYPEVLQCTADSALCSELAGLTATLLDSTMLDPRTVQPYTKNFVAQADKKWRAINSVEDVSIWILDDDIRLLGKLNTAESNRLLQQITQGRFIQLKHLAALQLLTNGQPVAAATLEKIAADTYYRITLYGHLKNLNKLALFPAAYATQRRLAESELYRYASEDEEPSKVSYIGARDALYQGALKTFHLFTVRYSDEGDVYLGVAGPYERNSKIIRLQAEATGLSGETYEPGKLSQQLNDYLKKQQAYENSKQQD